MLKIGIVGLPNVGKSTLFNSLTSQKVDVSNYPFCTILPNVGIVSVPDERLFKLAEMSRSKKVIPAAIEFVDIAGLVKGAAEGEGLGNKFLSHIKEVDAVAEVVRVFEDENITHVGARPNPMSDIETVEYELILKDLESVQRRLDAAETDLRGHKKGTEEEAALLKNIKKALGEARLASSVIPEKTTSTEQRLLKEMMLLTAKPFIYIFNLSERQISENWTPDEKIKNKIDWAGFVTVSAKIESELSQLKEEERKSFLQELGLRESGLAKLIKTGYQTLGLLTFFTTGEDESRAWTIPQSSTAPRAGRAIHSDFEEKFIRAEAINWQRLLEAKSWPRARELGWLKTVGKEYIVQDGDVIEFKI